MPRVRYSPSACHRACHLCSIACGSCPLRPITGTPRRPAWTASRPSDRARGRTTLRLQRRNVVIHPRGAPDIRRRHVCCASESRHAGADVLGDLRSLEPFNPNPARNINVPNRTIRRGSLAITPYSRPKLRNLLRADNYTVVKLSVNENSPPSERSASSGRPPRVRAFSPSLPECRRIRVQSCEDVR